MLDHPLYFKSRLWPTYLPTGPTPKQIKQPDHSFKKVFVVFVNFFRMWSLTMSTCVPIYFISASWAMSILPIVYVGLCREQEKTSGGNVIGKKIKQKRSLQDTTTQKAKKKNSGKRRKKTTRRKEKASAERDTGCFFLLDCKERKQRNWKVEKERKGKETIWEMWMVEVVEHYNLE